MDYEVEVNNQNQQFEVFHEGEKAEMVFRIKDKSIYLMHTAVPEGIGGQGIAEALTRFALKYTLDNKYQLVVYCPFVKAYIKSHPDWRAELTA